MPPNMGAPSLFHMCRRATVQHVESIMDVGDVPYDMIRPMLKKIRTPGQLYEIEKLSPHIAEEDAELWHAFIKRDIPNGESKIAVNTPTDPTKWHKVYRKLKNEDQRLQQAAEEQLIASLNRKKVEKEAHSTQIIHAVIPLGKKVAFGGPRAAPSGIQALKNARTTADRLTILKRQTAHRQAGRNVTQSIPTHELTAKRGTVLQAPKSMVNQYSRTPTVNRPIHAPQQTHRAAVFVNRVPGAMSQSERAINTALDRERQDKERQAKERRLRELVGVGKPIESRAATTVQTTTSRAATIVQTTTSRPVPKPTITRMPAVKSNVSQANPNRLGGTQPATSRPAAPTPPSKAAAPPLQVQRRASPPVSQSASASSSTTLRKRPAYNPMMAPAKKRKI